MPCEMQFNAVVQKVFCAYAVDDWVYAGLCILRLQACSKLPPTVASTMPQPSACTI